MDDAPAEPVVRLPWHGPSTSRPAPADGWGFESVAAVEIVAPDRDCAALLLDHAAPFFPAQLVSGPEWAVRFHPPERGREWVIELLALVERWLESVPLPHARLLHGDRDYLTRARSGTAPFAASTNRPTP
jgi:hypothetical protein